MGASSEELDAINTDVYRALVLNLDALPVEGKARRTCSRAPRPDEDVLDNEKRAYLVAAVATSPNVCAGWSSATSSRSCPCRSWPKSSA